MRGLGSGRVAPLLKNLVTVPVRVLHGGADDNVPPTQGRMLSGLLERLGGDVTYLEVPGQGHWWDLDKERPGADCVDSAELNAAWASLQRGMPPSSFTFAMPDPDVDVRRFGVAIVRQDVAGSESVVRADGPSLRTRNVAALHVSAPLGAPLVIDGQETGVLTGSLERRDGRWTPCEEPARKGLRPGGMAKALFRPFAIVLPTMGEGARRESFHALGRLIATAWWVRGNGHVPIVLDGHVTPALRASHALVLLGGPELNAETRHVGDRLLVRLTSTGARVAGREVHGPDLASAHWQPHPDAPSSRVLVLQASSERGDDLLPGLGIGGFAAAGFWSPDWSFDPSSSWPVLGPPAPLADAPDATKPTGVQGPRRRLPR